MVLAISLWRPSRCGRPARPRQAGHAALHVRDEHLDRAGDDRQLLLQEVAATGMPWRMRISLAVQQMPARVIPSAPAALASATISGSRKRSPASRTARLMAMHEDVHRLFPAPRDWPGCAPGDGVPKRMSEAMEATREPPQPSASEGPEGVQQEVPVVMVHPHVGAVQALHHHAVDALKSDIPDCGHGRNIKQSSHPSSKNAIEHIR
jgi:hypothetical protein